MMKGKIKKQLSIILVFVILFSIMISVIVNKEEKATSETYTDSNGITWHCTAYESAGTAKINYTDTEGLTNVVIPEKIIGHDSKEYEVIILDGQLFKRNNYNNSTITSITIPGSANQIEGSIFSELPALRTVTIEGNGLEEIPQAMFRNCTALTRVTLPNSLTSIRNSAFDGCTSLTSVNIPNNVSLIERLAFNNCTSLRNIDISNTKLTTISDGVFGDSGITAITLPSTVRKMEINAFKSCVNLERVNLNEGLTNIGEYAFEYCTALKNVTLPSSITQIQDSAFRESGLTQINLNEGLKIIDECALYNTNLTSLTLPSTVTTIGSHACYNNANLTTFIAGSNLKTIEERAFSLCGKLSNVTLNEGIESIGGQAFYLTNIRTIVIPSTIKSLSGEAFGARNLETVQYNAIEATVLRPFWNSGFNTNGMTLTIGEQVAHVSAGLSEGMNLKRLVFETSNIETTIGASAFANSYLEEINWNNRKIVSIGDHGFSGASITELSIPTDLTNIEPYTFENCKNLQTVTIPENITMIGAGAFSYTGSQPRNLTNVYIANDECVIDNTDYTTLGGYSTEHKIKVHTSRNSKAYEYITDENNAPYYELYTEKVTVTFKDEDGRQEVQTINKGENATAPNWTKQGYTLSWDTNFTNVNSNITVNAIWTARTDTSYKVVHHFRNLDTELEGYNEEEEQKTGTTDTQVTAEYKQVEGFTKNESHPRTVKQGTVEGDGSLVLHLYYTRNTYNITYKLNGGTITSPLTSSYIYGKEMILQTNRVTKEGYRFAGWYDNEELLGSPVTSISATSTGNKTFYAKWVDVEQEYYILSESYSIDLVENTITKVSPETAVSDFLNKIETNGQKKVINAQGQEITTTSLVGTGYKLQVTFKGQTYTYEIAVRGDLDGNGKITTTDLSIINQQILHKIELTGIKAKAADCDFNGRLSTTDLSMINQAVLRKITL